MVDFMKLLEKAKQVQEEMQAKLSQVKVEGSSGGGMVKVVMDGAKNVLDIQIDPEVINPDDREMLQDLIVAAFNDASAKAEEEAKKLLQELGLPFPGLF